MSENTDALNYFSQHAGEWRRRAQSTRHEAFGVIARRREAALRWIKTAGPVLDLGCGSGELLRELSTNQIAAVGVDFAPEMVQLAREIVPSQSVVCAEATDYLRSVSRPTYKVVVGLGFVEYLPRRSLPEVFEEISRVLLPNGLWIFDFRNRLFNLHSLNQFTEHEIRSAAALALLEEAVAFANSSSDPKFFHKLAYRPGLSPELDDQPPTGVAVKRRHQYAPSEVAKLLSTFDVVEMEPMHFHAFPAAFSQANLAEHQKLAGRAPNARSLVPFSSCVLAVARRRT